MKKYAFVVPRFSESNIGGAENLCASLACRLKARGDQIEIFTTCASDNRTWENVLPPGTTSEFGLDVHRFLVDPRNLDLWIPLQIKIHHGHKLSIEEQLAWMKDSVNSSAMYQEIASRSLEFDSWFFAPYLFGTTFHGSLLVPERAVLIPCLHDESYAYADVIASMFRQVRGCLFNAAAEQRLAERLYGHLRGCEVGMGFEAAVKKEHKPYFEEEFPYILYLGRKETGKNVDTLVKLFIQAKDSAKLDGLKLVIAGGGSFDDLHLPMAKEHSDLIDLGHLSEEEKQQILRHSLALCQPSTNESFSIVLMEGWLEGTPGLVSAYCDVTKEHVERSGGGLYFGNLDDFIGCCQLLMEQGELRNKMAAAGREYVTSYYSWENTMQRFDQAMELIFPG